MSNEAVDIKSAIVLISVDICGSKYDSTCLGALLDFTRNSSTNWSTSNSMARLELTACGFTETNEQQL